MRTDAIILDDVSKFYGEVLGVNRVHLTLERGITGLVGPNGAGKTTLMNLMTGLLQPTHGTVHILGRSPYDPEALFPLVGYSTQVDTFPRGVSGFQFVYSYLLVHGFTKAEADRLATAAIERVGLTEAADRNVAGFSKGMRQRIRLAQAIAHQPEVLVLDEPLNGLDPLARSELIVLLQRFAAEGGFVLISSHILHEVDLISDRVVFVNGGYVVAEGATQGVRTEIQERPVQIYVRCDEAQRLASRLFETDHVVEVKIHDDGRGLHSRTKDADRFYLLLNELVAKDGLALEAVGPADEDVHALYDYLISSEGDVR